MESSLYMIVLQLLARDYTFFMVISAEHEILPANKQQITDKYSFSCSVQLSVKFSLLINMKMPTLVYFVERRSFAFLNMNEILPVFQNF